MAQPNPVIPPTSSACHMASVCRAFHIIRITVRPQEPIAPPKPARSWKCDQPQIERTDGQQCAAEGDPVVKDKVNDPALVQVEDKTQRNESQQRTAVADQFRQQSGSVV